MKLKLLFLLLFFSVFTYSQSELFFFKDSSSNISFKTIEFQKFKPLKKTILEKNSNATFWFKIPANKSNFNYIFRVKSIRVSNAKAYQDFKEVPKLKNQRYVSFKISRNSDVFVKVSSKFSSYFPAELIKEDVSLYKEKIQFLINGFYYGIAFLVILFSVFYFYFFKDNSFLYHAFLLMSLTFSFAAGDGIFYFFNVNTNNLEFIIVLNYIFLVYSATKFSNNFLMFDSYYPKLKKYTSFVIIVISLVVVLYLISDKNELFIILNTLTFILLLAYWFLGLTLFRKNTHTKLFIFSYAIILFSGVDFFLLKNFGISFIDSNSANMKIGGFIQIIILSFAILFREKKLRKFNYFMKNEIIKFSKEIKVLTNQNNDEPIKESIENLSVREREVFNLIVAGKANKEIASEVNISVNTVKFHVKNIYVKLNVKSRKEVLVIKKDLK